jgi:hypothetical protein
MRAREFIREHRELPPEIDGPLSYTYVLPGLSTDNTYQHYRFGVAIARARSDYIDDDVNPYRPVWSPEPAFGKHSVVVGMDAGIEQVIDQALSMTKTPGGRRPGSSSTSNEPALVNAQSPLKPFCGYPR